MDNSDALQQSISTDRQCSALTVPTGKSRIVVAVTNKGNKGLCLEARGGRSKSWIFRFYIRNKQHKMTLGRYPVMSLAQARAAHLVAGDLVRQGIDPRHAIRQQKSHNEQMLILDQLFEQWIEYRSTAKRRNSDRAKLSPRTISDYRNIYKNHLQQALGKYRVCDISMSILHQHYKAVRKQSIEGLRKAMGLMRQMMQEAIHRELISISPTLALTPETYDATPGLPRSRCLDVPELRRLWELLDDAVTGGGGITAGGKGIAASTVLSGSIANVLKIVILTAVRRGEVLNMQWSQIDGDRWTIPDTKNGKPHLVTLSPLALQILAEQRLVVSPDCPYVFESTVRAGCAVTGDAITRALERLRRRGMGEHDAFCVHDLRRSVATCCGIELDVSPHVIEHMLNHQVSDKMMRVYQEQVLRNPIKLRTLFLRWGEFVSRNIASDPDPDHGISSNVVSVKFGKR